MTILLVSVPFQCIYLFSFARFLAGKLYNRIVQLLWSHKGQTATPGTPWPTMTMPSATFDRVDVREIGHRSFVKSLLVASMASVLFLFVTQTRGSNM